jgi:ankyrin repeat protein
LHQASFAGNLEVVDFLLKAHANPNAKTNDGISPDDLAIAKKNTPLAQPIQDFRGY